MVVYGAYSLLFLLRVATGLSTLRYRSLKCTQASVSTVAQPNGLFSRRLKPKRESLGSERRALPGNPRAPHMEAQLKDNDPPRRLTLRALIGATKR